MGERVFNYLGNPGLVELDPRWHQAACDLSPGVFDHILEGIDHLLFLFSLVIPLDQLELLFRRYFFHYRSFYYVDWFSIWSGASALWFPPLIETLSLFQIFYMASKILSEQTGTSLANHVWIRPRHGFGFSFPFSETLQFAGASVLVLLAFNIGVELGQIFILILIIPVLNLLFKYFVREYIGVFCFRRCWPIVPGIGCWKEEPR
ncbi:MAG: hypothetical protein CM1200mP40_33840 [Gammaproteobacteria bacterium]|nr:MAG: hypothetical protein CM1200mP40_33840 [Gammaproteobacteria bacterium]